MLTTDTERIQEAITHFGLNVARLEPVQESYSSVVRILTLASGQRLVLKIPFIQRKLHRELRVLQLLQGDLPVPEVVDYWVRDDGGPGALLLSYLPGAVLTGTITPGLAFGMGALLGRLHTFQVDGYGDIFAGTEAVSSGWWAARQRSFQEWQPLCAGVIPADLFQAAVDAHARLLVSLPEPDGPCCVHGDYRPGNVLVEGERITGLIDFESAKGGSGDLDFVKIKGQVWDRWPGTKEPFLEGYASVRPLPDIERTLPFYELVNAFGCIGWCVKRSRTDDPFFHENVETLERLVSTV